MELSMNARRRFPAIFCFLTLVASPMLPDAFHVATKEEILEAIAAQKAQNYNLLATPNGARFAAGVILHLARKGRDLDPNKTPILLDHKLYFEAFLEVTGVTRESAPTYIRIANENHEDQYIDYRRENVIDTIVTGQQPELAVNVVTGWNGPPSRYSYEDHDSEPALRVTHEHVTSYRLLDFGDRLLFDDIHGVSGRALTGLLGLVFKILGDAQAVRSFIAVSPDGYQVTLTTGRKGFSVTTTATVDRDGHGMKGLPPDRPDLAAIEERLKKPFEATYVPIRKIDLTH
jgi:hypothetical protein